MAIMIPAAGPQESENEIEHSIYYWLKRQLGDDFTVIHSLPWLAAAAKEVNDNKAPTGQIDFLILHAELGFLALEVKGGRYKVQGVEFVHIDKNYAISPVDQVRRNTHGLAKWLGVDPALRWKIQYALVFPNSDFGEAIISAALIDVTVNPVESIVIDRSSLPVIAARIREIMMYWRKALGQPALGVRRMAKLVDALCPEYDGTPTWASRVAFDNRMWLKLTTEQSAVINAINQNQHTLITGWPGTGKTVIAIEVARKKGAAGNRVLMLTFNKLLAEHVQVQLGSTENVSATTWHGFCGKAARLLGGSRDESGDWLEHQCLTGLEDAVKNGLLEKYDAILIDEAQAFRPEWIDFLCRWHQGALTAFCDESQVFSFEKERVTLSELCSKLGTPSPFVLTVPMRSPKAVMDRLASVRRPAYQLYTPRSFEPESIQEKLVVDMDAALSATVTELHRDGLAAADITVLSKFGWSVRGQQTDAYYESVSRFRGLESAAVVICNAEKMDDLELFSAYSRATTVCIALYDAETLGIKPTESVFHRSLLDIQTNAQIAASAMNSARTRGVVDSHLNPTWLDLNTVNIAWCDAWGAWLVDRSVNPISTDLWLDYLLSHYQWPAFSWSYDSIREVEHHLPAPRFDDGCEYGGRFSTLHCTVCEIVTPHNKNPSGLEACVLCDTKRTEFESSVPSARLLSTLKEFDLQIAMQLGNRTGLQLKPLPLSLAAAALAIYARGHAKRLTVSELQLPRGKVAYRAAVALVNSYITLLSVGREIRAVEMVEKTYSSYSMPEGLTIKQWKELIDRALAVSYNRGGALHKIAKGIYVPIP